LERAPVLDDRGEQGVHLVAIGGEEEPCRDRQLCVERLAQEDLDEIEVELERLVLSGGEEVEQRGGPRKLARGQGRPACPLDGRGFEEPWEVGVQEDQARVMDELAERHRAECGAGRARGQRRPGGGRRVVNRERRYRPGATFGTSVECIAAGG